MNGIRQQAVKRHEPHGPESINLLSKENARQQAMALLQESHALKTAVEAGHTRLCYALYDMETGAVEFFEF
jgi:hypothetical protein